MVEVRKKAWRIGVGFLLSICGVGIVFADSNQANYKLELSIDWSESLAPFEYPDDAHMSSLIGLTHGDRFRLFEDGATASSGLELVAENGRTGILKAQFNELRRRQRIGSMVEAGGIKSVPGKVSTTFKTTKDHTLLSVITMLAPSPDWFTGVSAVSLRADDEWVDAIVLPLWVWDAGTDTGGTFESENVDTQPRASTRLLSTEHFMNSDGLIRIGTISIERQR